MPLSETDLLLVKRVRAGEEEAWSELIARFEGRLLAFVEGRMRRRAAAEDVVQETFLGFLTSLPNFDDSRPLESYLFSIAAHKLTDALRREGRRPAIPLSAGKGTDPLDVSDPGRAVSSMLRSGERRGLEEQALVEALAGEIERLQKRGEWNRLACIELLILHGCSNKEAAARLGLSEQAVANYKFDFLAHLRTSVGRQRLPADVFPELHPGPPADSN